MRKTDILKKNADYRHRVAALLEEMAPYDDEQLNRSPAPGQWSPMQVLHHLILVEELALKYVQKKLHFQPEMPKASWKEYGRCLALRLYLYTPFKFQAPDAVGESKLPAYASLEQTRQQWLQVNLHWKTFLETMPDGLCDRAVFKHPLVGRLSWVGMFDFFSAHLLRHRKQIRRALPPTPRENAR